MEDSHGYSGFLDSADDDDLSFSPSRVKPLPTYVSYLKKIMGTMIHTEISARTAISPQCRHIFEAECLVEALPSESVAID